MTCLAKQIQLNFSTLTELDLMIPAMLRTYNGRKTFDESSRFFKALGNAEGLERVYLQADGDNVYDENVKQIVNSLKGKKRL